MAKLELRIIGNIGKDAFVNVIDNNTEVINFSVCHTEKFTGKDGVAKQVAHWVECSYFVKAGKSGIAQWLGKGSVVEVTGFPTMDHYTKQGETTPTLVQRLRVSEVVLIDAKKVGETANGSSNNQNTGAADQSTEQKRDALAGVN